MSGGGGESGNFVQEYLLALHAFAVTHHSGFEECHGLNETFKIWIETFKSRNESWTLIELSL